MPRRAKSKKTKTKRQYDIKRPPVVTMLGHVDHGKTSILDSIRGTKVQTCEAGGITQSVRAHKISYTTKAKDKYDITFIDTPGHEAFSQMRSRGAQVTDIAVLVVAVDDGVQPQTKEAIKYAKAAKVPIVVALNKVDIKGAEKAKVKRQLAENDVQVEDLGGDVICVETSAKEKKGLDELQEAILLAAEMAQLKKAKPKKGIAEAIVLESTLDKCMGPISLILVKCGEFGVGNVVSWNGNSEKVRAIKDESFCDVGIAKDSDPVWLVGCGELIPVGMGLNFCKSMNDMKKQAKEVKKAEVASPSKDKVEDQEEELNEEILADLLASKKDEDKPGLDLVMKSESEGTLEVVECELGKLSTGDVKINIIESGTGDISEDDILKAKSAGGIVVGFKSGISKKTEKIAKQEKVLVRNYEIIYELLEEILEVVEGLRKPEEKEVEVARAKIKKVFELSDGSNVAGCKVVKGTILKGYRCYVERPSLKKDNRLGVGKIVSLRHGKDEVREAGKDTECGIMIEPQVDIAKDDEVVCFKIEKE